MARFKGGRRQETDFRFVVQVDFFEPNDPEWIQVLGYTSTNSSKTRFTIKENDESTLPMADVICALKEPTLIAARRITYEFCGAVDVKEK